jgi:hypothetical protein
MFMDTGPLTLLMNVGGPILLGLAILVALLYTWRQRTSRAAQGRTDKATRNVYAAAEAERERVEGR